MSSIKIRLTEDACAGCIKLKMNEQQVLDFILGPDSVKNAVCMDDNGHYFCHRRIGTVTIWMEYHQDEEVLVVERIYHHRVQVLEEFSDAAVVSDTE